MSKMDKFFYFFHLENKLSKCHVNLYFLFYLVCSPKKSRMRPEAHVWYGRQASVVMLSLKLTITKKIV
jgi:hypothetical protein